MKRCRWATNAARCTALWTWTVPHCPHRYVRTRISRSTTRKCPSIWCRWWTASRTPRRWSITKSSSCPTRSVSCRCSTKRRTATRAFPIRTTRWRSRTSSVCRKSSPVRASNWYIHTSTWWWPCLPVQTCKSVRTTWKTLSGVWVSISASGHTTNWNCSSVRFRATATRSMRNTTVS